MWTDTDGHNIAMKDQVRAWQLNRPVHALMVLLVFGSNWEYLEVSSAIHSRGSMT